MSDSQWVASSTSTLVPQNVRDPRSELDTTYKWKVWKVVGRVLVPVLVILGAALFISSFQSPIWRSANEAVAVGKLRNINILQAEYAAEHQKKGFSCTLSNLKPSNSLKNGEYDPSRFLITGTESGYKFAIVHCIASANGLAIHYQTTAVPLRPCVTGLRAFCGDDSGHIWFDLKGSSEQCLFSRVPIVR